MIEIIEPPRDIEVRCRMCQTLHCFPVNASGFYQWQNENALIENALPELTTDQRELLISGICGPCFDTMFADEDQES